MFQLKHLISVVIRACVLLCVLGLGLGLGVRVKVTVSSVGKATCIRAKKVCEVTGLNGIPDEWLIGWLGFNGAFNTIPVIIAPLR